MLLLPIFIPLLGGLALLFRPSSHLKTYSNLIVGITAVLVFVLPFLVTEPLSGADFPFQVTFILYIDEISFFFSLIFVMIWWVVLQYSHHYFFLDGEKNRFYAFYIAVLGAMIGVAYAGNLVSLYLFFEFLGLLCIPLIAHDRSEVSLKASRKYLYYSVAGAFMGLIVIFYFYTLNIPQTFQAGGIPELAQQGDRDAILILSLLATVGFGCKAGLFPLHGWLKTAHPIAPAPASAVLSGITTKAGVIALLRLLYYVVGPEVLQGTFVQYWGLSLSMLTIFMGSMLAYREKVFKTRLAYSTVSQVSYVIFALYLFQGYAFVGAMLQVLFHAVAKTSLFLSGGTLIYKTGFHDVKEFSGYGTQFRSTFLLFTVAGMSLIGLPFTGGFVSKMYIALGGAQVGGLGLTGVVIVIASAILTAGYLLPIAVEGFYGEQHEEITISDQNAEEMLAEEGADLSNPLQSPVVLVILLVGFGLYPDPVIQFFLGIVDTLGIGGGI